MPIPEEFLSKTQPMHGKMAFCPQCEVRGLIRKTRDANSPYLGDVYCPSCQWVVTRQEYMEQIWPDLKDAE